MSPKYKFLASIFRDSEIIELPSIRIILDLLLANILFRGYTIINDISEKIVMQIAKSSLVKTPIKQHEQITI